MEVEGAFLMNSIAIVLQVLLGLVFLLFGFLAIRQHEADWYETFLTAAWPFMDSAAVQASQRLYETCFEIALQGHPATYEEYRIRSASERIDTPLLCDLSNGKDMIMDTYIHGKKQGEMVVHSDPEKLAQRGFTAEEITSLLWLRQWYQTGGSDRVELVSQWEFLRLLVLTGKLDL
jgi:hypothetical protein